MFVIGTSILYLMETTRGPRQLPTYFKKIGMAVTALSLITAVLFKTRNPEVAAHTKGLFRVFTLNALIIGLLLIALAKDKIEDEMIVAIRIRSMAGAFLFAVIYVIIWPLVDLVSNDPVADMSGQQIVLTMLFVYLFTYYMQKRRLR
jgi:hypothetical protein